MRAKCPAEVVVFFRQSVFFCYCDGSSFTAVAERDIFKSASKIPKHREVVTVLEIAYVLHTRQLWRFQLKLIKLNRKENIN
jgi:hypothetical protein